MYQAIFVASGRVHCTHHICFFAAVSPETVGPCLSCGATGAPPKGNPAKGNPAGQVRHTALPGRHRTCQPPGTRAAFLCGSCGRASRAHISAAYAKGTPGRCFRATAVGIGLRWSVGPGRQIAISSPEGSASRRRHGRRYARQHAPSLDGKLGRYIRASLASPGLAKPKWWSHMTPICVA